ncbi:MAG: hypothetical protein H7145_19450 [Akkermansiaceae bacterium]|nr:hypothetical protein [Armatimonadota bacterium]
MGAALSAIILTLLAGATGCSPPKAAPQTVSAAKGSNTNSKGLAKLTATEVEQKVSAVRISTTIPESAKPKIIESIRAQGEP